MNRSFTTEFHNGYEDEKPIVRMSVSVTNEKRFKSLDAEGFKSLYNTLDVFKQQVDVFMQEVDYNKWKRDNGWGLFKEGYKLVPAFGNEQLLLCYSEKELFDIYKKQLNESRTKGGDGGD